MASIPLALLAMGGGGLLSSLFGSQRGATNTGQQAQAFFAQYLQDLLKYASPFTDQGAATTLQFLSQLGIFSPGSEYDMGPYLQEIKKFRDYVSGGLGEYSVPWQLSEDLNNLSYGSDRAREIITSRGVSPETSQLRDRLSDIMNRNTPETDRLWKESTDILAGKGYTQNMLDVLEKAKEVYQNQGWTQNLKDLEGTGLDILSRGGRTPDTAAGVKSFQDIIASGGYTPNLQEAFGMGKQLWSQGGMTPQMQQLAAQINAGFQSGGMTPEARQLFGEVMKLVQAGGKGGALLPMEQVVSFARDAAATAMSQRAEAARRDAFQRQGASVASGTTEQALAEFGDEAARAEAQAIREAAVGQQDLQLKQLLGAMTTGGDIIKAAQQLLGTYASSGADIARSIAANMGTAGELMRGAEQTAADRLGTGTEGLNAMMTQELNRAIAAGDWVKVANTLANQRFDISRGAMTDVEKLAQTERGLGLDTLLKLAGLEAGAGTSLVDLSRVEAGRESTGYGALADFGKTRSGINLQSQDLWLKQKALELESWARSLGMSTEATQSFINSWLQGSSNLGQFGNPAWNLANTALGSYGQISSALLGQMFQPNFWNKLGEGVAAGGTAAIGDVIRGTAKPRTSGANP